ncbi:signal peptidase II [Moraxella bovis]|nr:signal peptidase II [Moraxella bovis]
MRNTHRLKYKAQNWCVSTLQFKNVKKLIMSENTQNKTPNLALNGKSAFGYYVLALAVLIIDQMTKIGFQKWLVAEFNSVPVIEPFFNWTLAYNRGAAFSFLANQGGWQKYFFALLGIAVSVFIIVYLRQIPKSARVLSFGLALVLGGAVGNVIDRFLYGYVIDFIHIHWGDAWHYPVFNVADMAIMGGMALVVWDMLFFESKRKNGVS